MTTHTLTIIDHPGDGEPIVSLDGGTRRCFEDVLLLPSGTDYGQDRTALIAAVRDLTGPRDDLPADLRDDRRIAWVPNAGDGEGAWFAPLLVRRRLLPDGWNAVPSAEYVLLRPPAPATEDVPWWEAPGRRTAAERGDGNIGRGTLIGQIAVARPSESGPGGMYVEYHLPEYGDRGNVVRNADGTVTVMADTDR